MPWCIASISYVVPSFKHHHNNFGPLETKGTVHLNVPRLDTYGGTYGNFISTKRQSSIPVDLGIQVLICIADIITTMCHIDKTNFVDCANSKSHNEARQVDPLEFNANYPQYKYQPVSPGYVPCDSVLQGQLSAKQCHDLHGPIEIHLTQSSLCPHCNCIRSKQGHKVTYRAGQIVLVTYFQDPQTQQTHQVHQPFVPFCLLCRNATGDQFGGGIGRGPPAQDVRFGYAPGGPPGREAYKSYGWGPSFR